MIEAATWGENSVLQAECMVTWARGTAMWRQRRAEIQTSQSEAPQTIRGQMFAVPAVRYFEVLAKCVLASQQMFVSWIFVETSRSGIKNQLKGLMPYVAFAAVNVLQALQL